MFDNNFGNRGPIFKILLPIDSEENSLCTYHKDFHITFNMLLHSVVYIANVSYIANFLANNETFFWTQCIQITITTTTTTIVVVVVVVIVVIMRVWCVQEWAW